MNSVQKKEEEARPPPPKPGKEEELLTEIRDALRAKKQSRERKKARLSPGGPSL